MRTAAKLVFKHILPWQRSWEVAQQFKYLPPSSTSTTGRVIHKSMFSSNANKRRVDLASKFLPVHDCGHDQRATLPVRKWILKDKGWLTWSRIERKMRVQVARNPFQTGTESPWGVWREWGSRCIRASPTKVPTARAISRERRVSLYLQGQAAQSGTGAGCSSYLPWSRGTAATVARPTREMKAMEERLTSQVVRLSGGSWPEWSWSEWSFEELSCWEWSCLEVFTPWSWSLFCSKLSLSLDRRLSSQEVKPIS